MVEIAWVISSDYQGQGPATEAAGAMVQWLQAAGVERFVAHINPTQSGSETLVTEAEPGGTKHAVRQL